MDFSMAFPNHHGFLHGRHVDLPGTRGQEAVGLGLQRTQTEDLTNKTYCEAISSGSGSQGISISGAQWLHNELHLFQVSVGLPSASKDAG